MRASHRLGSGLGKPKVPDLTGRDQILDGARNILDRNARIDAVLIEQVDHVYPKALERRVRDLPDVFGTAVETGQFALHDLETELGRDHDLVADRRERLAYDFLIRERSIDFRGVEERHATLVRGADQGYGVFLIEGGSIAEIEAHTAEAQGRNFKATFAEFALLHSITPWIELRC